jgi:hypothetical protein
LREVLIAIALILPELGLLYRRMDILSIPGEIDAMVNPTTKTQKVLDKNRRKAYNTMALARVLEW